MQFIANNLITFISVFFFETNNFALILYTFFWDLNSECHYLFYVSGVTFSHP